jgi:hypothetical protein
MYGAAGQSRRGAEASPTSYEDPLPDCQAGQGLTRLAHAQAGGAAEHRNEFVGAASGSSTAALSTQRADRRSAGIVIRPGALAGVELPVHDANFAVLAAGSADRRHERKDLAGARRRIDAALARFPATRHASDPRLAVYLLRVAAEVASPATNGTTRGPTPRPPCPCSTGPELEAQARIRQRASGALRFLAGGPGPRRALEFAPPHSEGQSPGLLPHPRRRNVVQSAGFGAQFGLAALY